MRDTLLVPILHTHSTNVSQLDGEGIKYHRALERSVNSLIDNLLITTPMDIYIFMKERHMAGAPGWLMNITSNMTNPNVTLTLLPINEAAFQTPHHLLRPRDMGWSFGFEGEYRMMGDWRLTFQPAFAREMGYQYVLQYDSDSCIGRPAKINLVSFMRDNKLWLANNPWFFNELDGYFVGLPELTAFWLRTRGRKPVGCIFDYTRPHDLSGLMSMANGSSAGHNPEGWTGWQGYMLSGHFMVMDLDWWFDRYMQDYVQLVVRTGAHIEHRWNELSVQSMMWQVFVPEQHFHSFKESEIEGHHGRREFGGWGRH
uniref:Uncharacterized protein n=1 Tax=Chlamydomonas leiostraca TaxID=1034604 RepID=A0A7S0RAN4_9CHLO